MKSTNLLQLKVATVSFQDYGYGVGSYLCHLPNSNCSPRYVSPTLGMAWFLCTGVSGKQDKRRSLPELIPIDVRTEASSLSGDRSCRLGRNDPDEAQIFSYSDLAAATNNFRTNCFLGEGGFGRVYKGRLACIDKVVAIKQLNLDGLQGHREFLVEVLMLNLLHHPNLVNLIGCCLDGDQRLLVYEYMPLGSLEDHLFDLRSKRKPLDWVTRMKIAVGAAKGLEYLHNTSSPPVIYRDMKCSNILLGEGFHPKLSDFGLAKLGPVGDKSHVSTRVMGTYGYCAPEYAMTGKLTTKSDVYSLGVVLLEILTGRRAIDNDRPASERNLVAWARPFIRDRRRLREIADPVLQGKFPSKGMYQALAISGMCVQDQPNMRPLIADVVSAFNYLVAHADELESKLSSHGNI